MNNYFSLCSFIILFASSSAFNSVNGRIFYSTKICFGISRITYYDLLTNGDRFLKICSISEINYEINAYNYDISSYTNCFYCQNSGIYRNIISVYMYNYDASCILPYPINTSNRTFYTDSKNLRNKLIIENIKNIDWTRPDSDFKRTKYFTIYPIYSKQYHNTRYPKKSNPIKNTTSLLLESSNYNETTIVPDYNNGSIPLTNSMNGFDRTTSDFRQKSTKNRYMTRFPSRRYNHRNSWQNQIYTTMRPWRWNQHKSFTPRHHYNERIINKSPRKYYHGYFRYNNGYNNRYNSRYESRFGNRNSWRNQIYTTMRPWRWNQHKSFTPRHHYNERIMTTSTRRYYHGYFRYNNGYNNRYNSGYESRFGNRNSWRNQIYTTMRPWRWNQTKLVASTHHYNERQMTIFLENRRRGMNSNNYQYKYHKLYDGKKIEHFSSYFAKYPYFNRHDFFWLSVGFFIFGACSLAIIGALIVKILSDRNKLEVIMKNKRSTLNGIENPSLELDVMPPRYDELNSNSNVIHNV